MSLRKEKGAWGGAGGHGDFYETEVIGFGDKLSKDGGGEIWTESPASGQGY